MKSLLALLASVTGLALATYQAQGQAFEAGTFAGITYPLRINATSNYVVNSANNTGWLPLKPAGGFAVVAHLSSTNASTSNVVITVQLSARGQNPLTTKSLTFSPVLTGTTGVVAYTNFTTLDITGHTNNLINTDLAGLNYFRLYSISNAHGASLFVTNVTWLLPRP